MKNQLIGKEVKVPLIICLVLYIVEFIIALTMTLTQHSLVADYLRESYEGNIIPQALIGSLINLLIIVIAFLVMQTYTGSSRRLIAGIIIGVRIFLGIIASLSTVFLTRVNSFNGEGALAAYSILNSYTSWATLLFSTVGNALGLVALGRYGITYGKREAYE